MAAIKDTKEYWRDKYLQLLEKYMRLGKAILKAMENIEPKKKIKPYKGISSGRGK